MPKLIELRIKNTKKLYEELVKELSPSREKPVGSVIFIVEGTKKNPIVGIRYPGRKLRKRTLKVKRANSALWANLYDFEVVPYRHGKPLGTQEFTYDKMLRDFEEHKRESEEFWSVLKKLYKNNVMIEPPKLPGIDSKLYLLVLKWMWIQEDLNYRFNWQEVNSPIKYVLRNKKGKPTAKGAGRAKSFAALILLKHHSNLFTLEQVKKIIPSY